MPNVTIDITDGETDVAVGSDIVLTFSEAVSVGSGNITIIKDTDSSSNIPIAIINNGLTNDGTSSFTINPDSDLDPGTDYHVQIDAAAFVDSAGNNLADSTTLNFTTYQPPQVGEDVLSFTDPTNSGINLNLILPVELNINDDTKYYYFLDQKVDGRSWYNDKATHTQLDNLLNEGNDTIATQVNGHNGLDDERSVVLDGFTLVLPTVDELRDLFEHRDVNADYGYWYNSYWTADLNQYASGGNTHNTLQPSATSGISSSGDNGSNLVIFQVI